jgi:hypothetical protein
VRSALVNLWHEHPRLLTWALLAVGMVVILVTTSTDAGLTARQLAFLSVICVLLAAACTWVISWEE